jgi:hypothetical protein
MNRCAQSDPTFGVYDMAMGAPTFTVAKPGLSLLSPSTRVAVPIAVPAHQSLLTPILHLQSLAAKIPTEFHLPDIPGMPLSPSVSIQKSGNLWMVDPGAAQAMKQILGMSSFSANASPPAQAPGGFSGSLSFSVMSISGDGAAQIDGFISRGFAAMASIASMSTGVIQVLFTQNPSVVATQVGGDSPTYVLLSDKPTAVVNAANAIPGNAHPVTPKVPSSGGGASPSGHPVAPATTPGWVVPLAVGAVLVGGAALILSASKK